MLSLKVLLVGISTINTPAPKEINIQRQLSRGYRHRHMGEIKKLSNKKSRLGNRRRHWGRGGKGIVEKLSKSNSRSRLGARHRHF